MAIRTSVLGVLAAAVLVTSAGAASLDARPKAFSRPARAGDVYPLRTGESVIASRRVASSGGAVLYVYRTLGRPALTCMRLVYDGHATGYCNPTAYTFAGDTNAFVDDNGAFVFGLAANEVDHLALLDLRRFGVTYRIRLSADKGFVYPCAAVGGCPADIASRHPRLQAVAYGAKGKMLGGTVVEGTSFR